MLPVDNTKEVTMSEKNTTSVMHNFTDSDKLFSPMAFGIFAVAIILGVSAGYMLSRGKPATSLTTSGTKAETSFSLPKGTVVGSNDTSTFKDTAEGVLQKGGIEDEGQFHLVRPGGDSQNVYLTSSIVDLSQFVGKKVKINGQTQKAQHAGWLMDVGRVEVLE
jgi:hypothetical protein